MNLDTLPSRLHDVLKRSSPMNNQNRQYPQAVSCASTSSTMIPTPGMSHNGNSNRIIASSVDTPMIAPSGCSSNAHNPVNTGNPLSTSGIHGAFYCSSMIAVLYEIFNRGSR